MKTYTFRGTNWRVQLTILDLLERVEFGVWVLPLTSHPATAFRATGFKQYFGQDADHAWKLVTDFAPDAACPRAMQKYLNPQTEN